jgi:hypothetical protein
MLGETAVADKTTTLAYNIDLNSGTGIFLTVLGIVVIVSSVLAVGRASLVKAQLEALRGDRDDLVERVNRVETENTALKADLKEEVGKRSALEKVVTGKEVMDKLLLLLDRHDRRAQHMDVRMILIAQKLGVTYEPDHSADPGNQPPFRT